MAYKRSRRDFETELQHQESPFVLYGTPLPPLDDQTRDDGSYVPVWKQEVTDDRGRKRLHGAFTGGFSAGYFNTVGSKEGWSPSTFVSSRTNRAKNGRDSVQQKPQDFMDEEDIREQEESQHLSTTQGFKGFGTADDVRHKDALTDLFRPTEMTIGEKLLGKMGWKQGQGIGPKVRRHIDQEDEKGELHSFAPADQPMLSFVKKTDHKGLGFEGNMSPAVSRSIASRPFNWSADSGDENEGRPGLSFTSRGKTSSKPKHAAFGVGVLNDTGSDDEDPYSIGPSVVYNRNVGREQKPKRKQTMSIGNANPLLRNRPIFVSKKLASISSTLRKCHDGRLPLDGFVLAEELNPFSSLSLKDEKYKPPLVPENWQSSQARTSETDAGTSVYQSPADAARASALTSSSRGTLLGESVLPGKSVFDFLTPAAREKLMKASGKTNLPPALSEALPGQSLSSSPSLQLSDSQIPRVDPQTALQALSRLSNGGFTPYTQNPDKAARYKSFLEAQANATKDLPSATTVSARPHNMKATDFITELHEFARVAEVFKPVSGLMASRFTTSTTSTSVTNSSHAATASSDPSLQDLLSRPNAKPKDPAEEAAQLGMFGHLTRSVIDFHPTRLLCKRFGVEMPSHPAADAARETSQGTANVDVQGSSHVRPPTGTNVGSGTRTPADDGQSRFQSAGYQHDSKGGNPAGLASEDAGAGLLMIEGPDGGPTSREATAAVDPDKNEALEQERPGAAIFRAIFGSDDEDED